MSSRMVPCSYCGEDIRADAKGCPHCGSDENTGWSDRRYMDGIDLPEDLDYEELERREFSADKPAKRFSWVVVVAAVLVVVLGLGIIRVFL